MLCVYVCLNVCLNVCLWTFVWMLTRAEQSVTAAPYALTLLHTKNQVRLTYFTGKNPPKHPTLGMNKPWSYNRLTQLHGISHLSVTLHGLFVYYRLEEPVLHSLWGRVVEGFFSYISLNLNGSGWNLEYKWGVTVDTHTQNFFRANRPRVTTKNAKMCFIFSSLILHRFWPLLK